MLRIYQSKVGLQIDGTDYYFQDINSVNVADPLRKHLTRGANSQNKVGLPYQEGSRSPCVVTFNAVGVSSELASLIRSRFKSEKRVDGFAIDDTTGENCMFKNSLITRAAMQENISDGEDTYDMTIELETFNYEWQG